MRKLIKSVHDAFSGLATVFREERNYKIEVAIGVIVLVFALVYRFSYLEIALLVFACSLVITGEIINTTIEDLCDKVEPNIDPAIGKIKDMMASFVLVSSICSVIIGILVFLSHFLS